ncbi:MAG: succinate dehydrogenase cytochrome b subunit [Bacteroidetes bacterium]|nr:MAG: succinate dehydrogenase cytochrome b subunit [Bacteroidota bacterium]
MNWFLKMFSSSIGQKVIMALTGLFLCLFLVIHLTGNFQLLLNDSGYQFNTYAKFMTSNPLIKIAGYITYLSILFHAFKGLHLAYKNSQARKRGYRKSSGSATSTWMSRSMGLLGTIILVFIVVHMQQFWYQYKFGKTVESEQFIVYLEQKTGAEKAISMKDLEVMNAQLDSVSAIYQPTEDIAGFEKDPVYLEFKPLLDDLNYSESEKKLKRENLRDLYAVVKASFQEWWIVLLYVVSMAAIAFHLLHGFQSAFQTMGWKHSKYNGLISTVGALFSILIPIGFAAIPLIMYFR